MTAGEDEHSIFNQSSGQLVGAFEAVLEGWKQLHKADTATAWFDPRECVTMAQQKRADLSQIASDDLEVSAD